MENIILLHGALGSKQQFNDIAALLEEKYRVHALNFYGHAGENFSGDFSISAFAEQVLAYLDREKIEAVTVFGHSLGGYVGLYLARHYPNRIQKVITLNTKFSWSPQLAQQEVKMLDPVAIESKVPAFAKELEKKHGAEEWKQLLERTAGLLTDLGNGKGLNPADYTEIQQPVLIGLGDRDKMVTMEESREVSGLLKNGGFYVLPYTKHPWESVDVRQLSAIIANFSA